MHVMIIGAAGMIGRKLTDRLLDLGKLAGQNVGRLTLADVVAGPSTSLPGARVEVVISDLSMAGEAERLVAMQPDIIFHLAAIVSSDAEANFEKGYTVNLDGTRNLLEAIRHRAETSGYKPRFVFTSSIAVYGQPLPEQIPDDYLLAPLTSYGTQKAICELLINDYSRRGFLDGISLRLPTICVRPGKPNKAASGFYSSILREPLAGLPAILPVDKGIRHWFASPRTAVRALIHSAEIDLAPLGARRALNLPGVSATVADQIDALRKVAGDGAVALISEAQDPTIHTIVSAWPQAFAAQRAAALGFSADESMEEIIRIHIEDDRDGAFVRSSSPAPGGSG